MEQFAASVNEFLTFRRYALLPDKGKVSREEADRKAEEEYRLFNPTQRIDSDFDKEVRGLFDSERESYARTRANEFADTRRTQ